MTQLPRTSRILVAEDDTRVARVLGQLLREDAYDVEVVSDLDAAVARLSRGPAPDVVVTDLRRPFGADMAVISCARAARSGLPIVVIASDVWHAQQIHQSMSPPPKVLPKPLVYEHLCEALVALGAVGVPRPPAVITPG
ncbi:MAG: response regulator [Byssovorax sp.]